LDGGHELFLSDPRGKSAHEKTLEATAARVPGNAQEAGRLPMNERRQVRSHDDSDAPAGAVTGNALEFAM
jgi:hypothetical protein